MAEALEHPFGEHDYKICYRTIAGTSELRIRGERARALIVGDRYSVERHGEFYEIVVHEVVRDLSGAWSAHCRLTP